MQCSQCNAWVRCRAEVLGLQPRICLCHCALLSRPGLYGFCLFFPEILSDRHVPIEGVRSMLSLRSLVVKIQLIAVML